MHLIAIGGKKILKGDANIVFVVDDQNGRAGGFHGGDKTEPFLRAGQAWFRGHADADDCFFGTSKAKQLNRPRHERRIRNKRLREHIPPTKDSCASRSSRADISNNALLWMNWRRITDEEQNTRRKQFAQNEVGCTARTVQPTSTIRLSFCFMWNPHTSEGRCF